jgi:hypothetical protein
MHHRPRPRSLAAVLATAAVLLALAACNAAPSASVLTDPKAILTTAITNASQAKSVHVDATAAGSLPISLAGGIGGAGLDLTGTTASADVDLANTAAHATFAAPGLLGLRGELIAVGGVTYLKTTLTGPLFKQQSSGAAPSTSPAPSGAAAAMLQSLQEFLSKPGVDPTLAAEAPCGSGTCYTVEIDLTPAELQALQAGSGVELPTASLPVDLGDLADSGLHLTFHVAKDTLKLAGLTAVVDMDASASAAPGASAPSTADVTVDLTFTKWDEPVTITAPPADQIAPAS